MGSLSNFFLAIFFVLQFSFHPSSATTRKLNTLVQQQPLVLNYHNGRLLKGDITVNLVWYGSFKPSQRSIIMDFLNSLSPSPQLHPPPPPSVSSWWSTTEAYKGGSTNITVGELFSIDLGSKPAEPFPNHLTSEDLLRTAGLIRAGPSSITVVLTSADVTVEGFCSSRCGTHGVFHNTTDTPFIWVGNSGRQCPGQCAWPFHKPIYGPQTPPLVAPNGDVGVDGMVINLATLLAGTVTNPFGEGFFQGPKDAATEAGSACTGVFGTGSYPGYPGQVLVDKTTGASYNSRGLNGREYLLPAMWDPKTSQCSTLV